MLKLSQAQRLAFHAVEHASHYRTGQTHPPARSPTTKARHRAAMALYEREAEARGVPVSRVIAEHIAD